MGTYLLLSVGMLQQKDNHDFHFGIWNYEIVQYPHDTYSDKFQSFWSSYDVVTCIPVHHLSKL